MAVSDARPAKGCSEVVTVHASAQRSASGNTQSTPVTIPAGIPGLAIQFDVTAAASAVDDTLDLFLQTTLDGTNWIDIAHATQVLGNGGAKQFVAKIGAGLAEALFAPSASLAAGSVRNILGDKLAARWAIGVGAGTHLFTFSVVVVPM